MTNYSDKNAQAVLTKVEERIAQLEGIKASDIENGYFWRARKPYTFYMREVCTELSIFDWWNNKLSLSQLKDMRTFLREAVKLGYTGYVCFKVGATGCANGMWAHKAESTNGYSPDGEFVYRSFTPDYTYWDICDYTRTNFRLSRAVDVEFDGLKTARALENAIREYEDTYVVGVA